jgi:hypothetical protein
MEISVKSMYENVHHDRSFESSMQDDGVNVVIVSTVPEKIHKNIVKDIVAKPAAKKLQYGKSISRQYVNDHTTIFPSYKSVSGDMFGNNGTNEGHTATRSTKSVQSYASDVSSKTDNFVAILELIHKNDRCVSCKRDHIHS